MAAVGVRQLDHFRGTSHTALLVEGKQEEKIHSQNEDILFLFFEIFQFEPLSIKYTFIYCPNDKDGTGSLTLLTLAV